MKNWKLFAVILATLVFILAACGDDKAEKDTGTNTNENKQEASGAFPMTISPTIAETKDEESGQTTVYEDVTFEKMPERIVVFDFGFLDTLNALGVEGIVGVPKDGTLPKHLSKFAGDEYASVGNLKTPDLEEIAALEPDAIFISGRQATFYDQLKEITPNVVFVGTSQDDYWGTFEKSVDIAAKLFGKEKEAEDYLAKFDSKLDEIKNLAGQYKTSLVTMYNEGKLSGFGKNSRFGYVYDIYGFTPVTDDIEASSHGSDFGFESILKFDPEVLFVIDRTAAIGGQSNIEADMENDIIKQTQAYKNGKIVYLDGALWYLSGGGLQSEMLKIEEILEELK
ncbi:siderophore ABC transporter substrate-binding protein [Ureibacillus sp. FSL K6-8385]|uniref:Siderophore ABC transporter substrate-binding protein n=1 Tax=Ureibacillus terrenus TaxID=118246 RepID=A0A540V0U6_9BACL|nr:siderophore ABC transporter substrate-binding protein [Ureibacillus terrenus]MED3662234.1 siderophore ABC transporter substrate-binding protein [Ureibacillus terrenus]MED3764072.1 siderophore ABC transporter substrate-binding protein [Ureibacillus terrenus]TQE90392.1 siderophore ABC transporter substrate-binding protein [Ureibacillus terrenus]